MEDLFTNIETIEQSQYGRAVAPVAQARHDDPAPSVEAAARMNRTGKTARDQAKVLAVARDNPGLTAVELFQAQGLGGDLDRYDFSRRLPELEAVRLVRRGPARKCSVNGTNQATWTAIGQQPKE